MNKYPNLTRLDIDFVDTVVNRYPSLRWAIDRYLNDIAKGQWLFESQADLDDEYVYFVQQLITCCNNEVFGRSVRANYNGVIRGLECGRRYERYAFLKEGHLCEL